jgi:hypothetical protein
MRCWCANSNEVSMAWSNQQGNGIAPLIPFFLQDTIWWQVVQIHLSVIVMDNLFSHEDCGIMYNGTNTDNHLKIFCNANFAGDQNDCKSCTWHVFTFGNGAIMWWCNKEANMHNTFHHRGQISFSMCSN